MLKKALATTLAAVLCHGACAQVLDNHIDNLRSDAPELAAYGAFPVGVKTLQWRNPGQLDIVNAKADAPLPRYDRPMTVELWYPAMPTDAPAGSYRVLTRDGKTEATLYGRARRAAAPDASRGPYPLVIISHGYPGNRFLLSHLGENLASKGYVVVSIDHTDSTYGDQKAFGSTLLNRSLDQLFAIEQMARLGANDPDGTLKGLVDVQRTGLIGYSMGGYGVLNAIGGGYSAAAVANPQWVPQGALAVRQAGNPAYQASMDPRIKAAVVFGPWGWRTGMWDAAGLAGIRTPVFFVAGSADTVSGYAPGVRNLFEASANAPRYLLTFDNAGHNAGAPIPAPVETWAREAGKAPPAEHYVDAVWDNNRMNNIAQHFTTAFLGRHLRNDMAMQPYLDVTAPSADCQRPGETRGEAADWKGFAKRAVGLRLERCMP